MNVKEGVINFGTPCTRRYSQRQKRFGWSWRFREQNMAQAVDYHRSLHAGRRCRVARGFVWKLDPKELPALETPSFGWGAESLYQNTEKLRTTWGPVIVGDFSENYSLTVQEEIQSLHWDVPQCTIHPFVVCWRENDSEHHQRLCFVSDETKHSARYTDF